MKQIRIINPQHILFRQVVTPAGVQHDFDNRISFYLVRDAAGREHELKPFDVQLYFNRRFHTQLEFNF